MAQTAAWAARGAPEVQEAQEVWSAVLVSLVASTSRCSILFFLAPA